MTAITIKDLRMSHDLDGKAMSRITGAGGAPWVYGWARPYTESSRGFGSDINFYQTNNFFIADQINNQISVIDITNSAANSIINVNAKQQSFNLKHA